MFLGYARIRSLKEECRPQKLQELMVAVGIKAKESLRGNTLSSFPPGDLKIRISNSSTLKEGTVVLLMLCFP